EEIFVQVRIETRQPFAETGLDFLIGAEKGRAQHEAGDAVRMRPRISQRQGRAPGAAGQKPALEAEFPADDFQVGDQMRQRVGLARAFRPAAAAAALVEQHRVETLGIEQPAVIGLAARAGAAMQIDGRNAAFATDAFDIELVTVADGELFRGQWRERIGARASAAFPKLVIHWGPSHTNFGNERHWPTKYSGAAFDLKFLARTRGRHCRNFKSAAPGARPRQAPSASGVPPAKLR